MRLIRPLVVLATAVAALALAVAPATASSSSFAIPPGFRTVAWEKLGTGLDHVTMRGNYEAHNVHVARLKPDANFALRAVVSRQAISGGLETTSSMCRRVKCIAGINGDFFNVSGATAGQTVGGLSIFGQALRSPTPTHPQLLIGNDGTVRAGTDSWKGGIKLADGRGVTLDGVNVALRGGKISLFTAAFGKATRNAKDTTEIRIRIEQPRPPLQLGTPARIRFLDIRHIGGAPIPPDGAVIAGNGAGAQALDALWWQIKNKHLSPLAELEVSSPHADAIGSIGGSHVLLKDGRRTFQIVPRGLIQGRHPRTVVGWNKQGEIFLVTADGRRPRSAEGMSLLQITRFMQQMGATDAINLDGGGSTTFVTRGRVINQPSGSRERGVATALVIVPVAPKPKPAAPAAPVPAPPAPPPVPAEPAPATAPAAMPAAITGASRTHGATSKDHAVAIAFLMALGSGAAVVRSLFERVNRSYD
ncbi:MAG TPA: phosphodiester glycosidase family protein [Actinomycetota bacterium]